MSDAFMVCGTASDVGKTQIVTGLCRAFARRGIAVAPFKGQNMALNSLVTVDGAEIGRAQGAQAYAAGIEPEAVMNPVLLKPTSDRTSQVIVRGKVWRTLDALSYHEAKAELVPVVDEALQELRQRFELVICEGAGSPAEINLFEHDLVNLGLAARHGLPAIVVGDIDRGGVFAHLYGTVALLPAERRHLVRGFIVNKFRGDPALLGDATAQLEGRCGVPTLGVVPHLEGLWLDAEDSMALLHPPSVSTSSGDGGTAPPLDVAVLQFPRISNFTDLDPLRIEPAVQVRYVSHAQTIGDPDLVILPGTKSTAAALSWLRGQGLDEALEGARRRGTTIVGICGGYQILGRSIDDPDGVESDAAQVWGLGWLPVVTRFGTEKLVARQSGRCRQGGNPVSGYELHHGQIRAEDPGASWFVLGGGTEEGVADVERGVFGTSLHGLFEEDGFRTAFLESVARRRNKGWTRCPVSFAQARNDQIDLLADACEACLDVDRLGTMSIAAGAVSS